MLKRRQILKGAAISSLAIGTPMIARAQAQHDWKLVTSVPKGLPGPGVSAQRWADRITQMTDGEIKVTLYGVGELVPPFGTQEAVESGTAQAYHGSGSWFSGRDIAHAFFTGVPFGLTFDEMHAWMYYGGGQELLNEFTNPRGLQIFIGGGSGMQTFGWFKNEIKGLSDLQGLNFRAAGLGGQVLSKLGMNAVSIPPSDIFSALQSGTLDGAEWVGPANDLAFGFQNVAKYMYTPTFVDVYGGIEFGVNLAAWEALSDAQRTIVEAASEAEANRSSADTLHANLQAFERFKADDSLTIAELPADIWDALRAASKEVMDDVAATSDFHGRLTEAYYAYAEQCSGYKARYDAAFTAERQPYFG
ncbi:TRAP transporter substrate-binding protein [Sulfitobacter sp. HNIBRBA3233]|uniref:TRAP transporter substrate-binding protein n=1 Tax=Sulfitobacter marinivivus TaxID=3158558 RepID=UPI0032DF0A18